MKTTQIRTKSHESFFLVLEPIGRRVHRNGTYWCEPEHRGALGKALQTATEISEDMTKSQLVRALHALGKTFADVREAKDSLAVQFQNALIDVWVPEVEI